MKIHSKLAALALITATLLSGCSSPESAAEDNKIFETYAAVIDVRTVEEFNGGHLSKAILISVEPPDFSGKISELDKSADYFIYCRSGNRAGQAIEIMKELGFTGELVNGGSVMEASKTTGLKIVNLA